MLTETTGVLSPQDALALGHYRAVSVAAGISGLSAGGILATLSWHSTALFRLTRLAAHLEVVTAITSAPVFDLEAYEDVSPGLKVKKSLLPCNVYGAGM